MFMEELTLTTPSILFSAVSLILLAYTNRFLSYAQVIRNLKAEHDKNPTPITQRQLDNLRKRLYMSRSMQIFGVSSLLLCVLCTFLIYIGLQTAAGYTFGIALVLLVISLWISVREVIISVRALEVHLDDMKTPARAEKPTGQRSRTVRQPRPKATYTDPNTLGTTNVTEMAISGSEMPQRPSTPKSGGNRRSGSRSRSGAAKAKPAGGSGSGSGTPNA